MIWWFEEYRAIWERERGVRMLFMALNAYISWDRRRKKIDHLPRSGDIKDNRRRRKKIGGVLNRKADGLGFTAGWKDQMWPQMSMIDRQLLLVHFGKNPKKKWLECIFSIIARLVSSTNNQGWAEKKTNNQAVKKQKPITKHYRPISRPAPHELV